MKVINKRAGFDYELGEKTECGIQLTGAEVKSVKLGQVDLSGAQVKMAGGEAWVLGLQIYPYKFADNEGYDPRRKRKLLLGGKEMVALESKMKSGRLRLVPTAIYTKGRWVKLEVALARAKRKREKRGKLT